MPDGEVLFEFVRIGAHMRCAAFDVETGTEVIVVGPAQANRYQLERLALAKLRRKLAEATPPPPPSPGKFA